MKRTGTRLIALLGDERFTSHSVVIKVGMVGDSQIGKTSLMVKYVEGSFDEDYIQTLGTSLLFPYASIPLF
jgi:GTPase SAR1 family protein